MSNSSVHIDETGCSVAFWLKGISGINVLQSSSTSSFPGTWSGPVNVSDPTISAALPNLGNNLLGDSVLIWAVVVSPGISNHFASIRPIATGIWSARSQLVNVGSVTSPTKISINETGDIIAQWTAYVDGTRTSSAIYVATATVSGGTWSAVQRLSPP